MRHLRYPRLTLGVCIVVMASAQVGLAHQRYTLNQEAGELQKHYEHLQADVNKLSLELASMSRPERLRQLAKSRGMGPPLPMQVVHP